MVKETDDQEDTAWKIFYDGQLVHTLAVSAIRRVSDRSTYFESLVDRWGEATNETQDHNILPLASVGPMAVSMVLRALDDSYPLSSEIVESTEATTRDKTTGTPFPEQIIQTAFYLGCDDFILPLYCAAAKPRDKKRVAYYLFHQGGQPNELQSILSTPHFFDGFDKQTFPLLGDFCVSLKVAVLLLEAYEKAPEQGIMGFTGGLLGSVKRIWAPKEAYIPSPLSASMFGLLTIQKFVLEEWSVRDMDVVFPVLPPTPNTDYSKPPGLETFLNAAIRMEMEIPPAIRNWNVDVTQIGPVLFEMDLLDEAPEWPNPDLLVRAVTDNWTARDCLSALERNKGGIRRLFEVALPSETCDWLANIPIFEETCCIAPEGNVQRLLYRHLFMHMDFDPRLPPTLLSILPYAFQEKALEHAVRYLENGEETGVEELNLPWEYASKDQTQRAAAALRHEDSTIWRRLDISKLRGGRFLEFVPTKVLALLSYEDGFRTREKIRHQKLVIRHLEGKVDNLEQTIRRLERQVSQSLRHQPR